MNKKKILQIILAGATFSGGMSLANSSVAATELTNDNILDIESIMNLNDSYEVLTGTSMATATVTGYLAKKLLEGKDISVLKENKYIGVKQYG